MTSCLDEYALCSACRLVPVRSTPATFRESVAAELTATRAFARWFRGQHPAPTVMAGQYDYLTGTYDPESYDPVAQVILKYLRSDWKNPLSTTRRKSFEKAYRDGTLTEDLVQDMIKFEGWNRKPDMLGIASATDPALLELLEVGTVLTQGETEKELNDKLRQLRDQVVPNAERELRATRLEAQVSMPTSVEARPTAWRPAIFERAVYLPAALSAQGKPDTVEWICFQPTFSYNFGCGIDGLAIYHIHEVKPGDLRIPWQVAVAVASAIRRWQQQHQQQGLELLPELVPVWAAQRASMDPAAMRFIGYATVVMFGLVLAALLAPVVVPLAVEAGTSLLAYVTAIGATEAAAGSAWVAANAFSGMARAQMTSP